MSTYNSSQQGPSPSPSPSDILTHLVSSTTALEDLHSTLLASLQRVGWTERVRQLSLELIRVGRCEKFDDIVDAVVACAEGRDDHAAGNGHHHVNGNGITYEDSSNSGDIDVRVPPDVVEQGVGVIREALGETLLIEAEDESSENGHGGKNKPAKSSGKKNK